MWKCGIIGWMGMVVLAGWGSADILRVEKDGSGNFGTIQAAIDAAAPGDVIVVGDGTWQGDGNRDITFRGKTITVRSKSGPDKCIIDCQGGELYLDFHRGFVFQSEELREAILEGFTITGGVHSTGAGILCNNGSNPTIRGNIIAGNRVPYDWDGGGGIACKNGAAPWIVGNIIRDNVCEPGGGGGGIVCYESGRVEIAGNMIVNNSSSYGGGIEIGYLGSALVENNLIAGNQAGSAGGVGFWGVDGELSLRNNTIACNQVEYNGTGVLIGYADDASVVNCIVWGNYSSAGTNEQIVVENGSAYIRYCCIQDWGAGGTGNIRDDPLFVDAAEGDFHLQVKSPCVNTGYNTAVGLGVTDLDGRPRIQDGTVDMGAYEFSRPRAIYVDDSATGANDGTSWSDAYLYLQDALAMANSGDGIRIAQGRYRPDQSAYLDGLIEGDRNASFRLKSGVAIRGGYAGHGSTNPDERDIERYNTILTGDLNNDDGPDFANNSDNSLHVVTAEWTESNAVLDGFIITGGNACDENHFERSNGGGLYCDRGSPTVIDCTFRSNYAGDHDGGGCGGGIYSTGGSPSLVRCGFVGNRAIALDGGEGRGGALGVDAGSVTLTECSFLGNVSGRDGGAVFCSETDLTAIHCLFSGNLARLGGSGSRGGALCAWAGNLNLSHCTFANNVALTNLDDPAADYGGALFIGESTNLTLQNSVLWANSARYGSQIALYPYGVGFITLRYCDIQGGYEGIGNIDVDPLFAKAGQWIGMHIQCDTGCDGAEIDFWESGDYHLKSQAGRWDAGAKAWVQDAVTSPCIDAGDPGSLIGLEPFPNGGVVNMGAYGGTVEASKSWFGGPVCDTIMAGDINGDCSVNLADFAILAGHWLEAR